MDSPSQNYSIFPCATETDVSAEVTAALVFFGGCGNWLTEIAKNYIHGRSGLFFASLLHRQENINLLFPMCDLYIWCLLYKCYCTCMTLRGVGLTPHQVLVLLCEPTINIDIF